MIQGRYLLGAFLLVTAGALCFNACSPKHLPNTPDTYVPPAPEASLTTPIAFTSIYSNSLNSFTFMTLADVPNGTTLYFAENPWDGTIDNWSPKFNPSVMTFISIVDLPPGTQVVVNTAASPASIYNVDGTTTPAGIFSSAIGMTGDKTYIIAFQVPQAGQTVFLTAVDEVEGTPWQTSGPVNSQYSSYLPPGLIEGVNAVDLSSIAGDKLYACPGSGGAGDILFYLSNPNNWNIGAKGTISSTTPVGACGFYPGVTPVPTAVPVYYTTPTPTSTPTVTQTPTVTPTVTVTPTPTI
jgi:hypothetical protein